MSRRRRSGRTFTKSAAARALECRKRLRALLRCSATKYLERRRKTMQTSNASSVSACQRIQKDFSLSPQEEFRRDGILAQAYLQIVAAFDCRPEPRAAWDRTADGTEKRW